MFDQYMDVVCFLQLWGFPLCDSMKAGHGEGSCLGMTTGCDCLVQHVSCCVWILGSR